MVGGGPPAVGGEAALFGWWVRFQVSIKGDGGPLWMVGVDLPYFGDLFIILDWNLNDGIIKC